MEKGAKVAIECMNIQEFESVLIVSDDIRESIGRALEKAGEVIGCEVVYMEMNAKGEHGGEPPSSVSSAMMESDVVFAPTTYSLTHTEARKKACENGARIATMPGITEEMMDSSMNADYSKIKEKAEELKEKLEGAKNIHISSDKGTDLSLDVEGRTWNIDAGQCEKGEVTNLPAGEVFIAPISGDGRLVIDGSFAGLGKIDRIEILFEDGEAIDISDSKLEDRVNSVCRCGRNLAEFGIGLNPNAVLIGEVLQDEKVKGTIHIAIGDNSGFGGNVNCDLHLDGVVENPTVEVDGEKLDL